MADDAPSLDKKKAHRPRQSGIKAEKKKSKTKKPEGENLSARQRNPKAFAINSAIRAERQFRRKEDLTAKKQHIPVVDQTPDEPPPVLIAVVGPSKVGKSTLINNLIKSFTKTKVNDIKGPITIITSKKRRITLVECNNDINSMIDIAKCADLVLLLCDASFGFEMEIFEFLNICQVHGMPKIMGVLTHLDMIKNAKVLKRRKKELKHRFWTEVYDGAKLFYLSGIIHGEYLRNEITNLGRFISVMKFRPLTWRGAHSYVLVDRVEDVTNTEMIRQNPKCDRNVVLYGYVRGVPMNKSHMVHIAGVGDMRIDELNALPDPCPLPGTEKKRSLLEKERLLYAPMSGVGGLVYDKDALYIELQGSHSHRDKINVNPKQEELISKLKEKRQTIDQQIQEQEFRLFSDGDVIKSKDFKQNEIEKEEDDDEISDDESDNEVDSGLEEDEDNKRNVNWMTNKESENEDEELEDESSDEEYQEEIIKNSDDENGSEEDSDDENGFEKDADDENGSEKDSDDENDSEEDSDDNDEEKPNINMAWKENLTQKAREAYFQRQSESKNLMKLVYGVYRRRYTEKQNVNSSKTNNDKNDENDSENEEELGGLFKIVTEKQTEMQKEKEQRDQEENCFFEAYAELRNWTSEENKELIKNCFVTGKWKASEDAEELLNLDDMSDGDSEVYGDFEDLETGEKHSANISEKSSTNESKGDKKSSEQTEEENSRKRKLTRVEEENLTKTELMEKKMKLKAKFDAEYDNKGEEDDDGRITGDHEFYEKLKAEAQRQSELNKNEFSHLDDDLRIQIEGYRAGLYVRMGFTNVSSEFIENFDPNYPVLVGGLNMSEENIGYVNCKVKKHRWYKKILKTGDPLIISLGWRRFQTRPIYSNIEDNMRFRYLKYTPNHVICNMTFWGPITPQNTGFLALQTITHDLGEMKRLGFRIAATGCVTEVDKSTQIMKKLKLVGTPFKIYKKTAFIKGMFNTSLEVAKFEGAKIKTVSGIRGQIKKAHSNPEGSFRATFEDRILLSDIVFCRTWFRVDVPKFYAPITSLLLPPEQKSQWQGMKTSGQLKREKDIKNQPNYDSLYTDIKREPKTFRPLTIPKSLQRALPYKDKPKYGPIDPKKSIEANRIAVIRSPHEQKVAKMMKMIETNYEEKKKKEKKQMEERLEKFKQQKTAEEMRKLKRQKELRRKISRALSKMNKKEQLKTK